MTVPVAESYATTTDTGRSGTTLSLNIPSGVAAGEVLYAVVTDQDNVGTPTFPAGWTEIFAEIDTFSTFECAATGAFKVADGTEAGTISVTVTTNGSCGIMYRISGAANPNYQAPAVTTHSKIANLAGYGPLAVGSTVLPETDSETNDYLTFASLSWEVGTDSISANPQDLSSVVKIDSGTSVGMWIGHRDCISPMEVTTEWDTEFTRQGVVAVVLFYPSVKHTYGTTHPYVRSISRTTEAGRVTSTTYKAILPRVVHPGDLLLLFVCQCNVTTPQITWPDGWTQLFEEDAASAGPSAPYTLLGCAYKRADGSDGATVTIPKVASVTTCSLSFSLGNVGNLDSYPPEYNSDSGNTGDIDNLTPSYGSANYMFMAVSGTHSDNDEEAANGTTIAAFPTGTASYTSRAFIHSNDTFNPGDNCAIVASWGEVTGTSSTATGYGFVDGSTYIPARSHHIAFYGGTPDPEQFWYLNWRGKGRNGFM